jgi:hypothetical protein
MISDFLGDLNEVMEGLVALFMLISSLVGVLVGLYYKAKTREADLGDFLEALKEAEGEISQAMKSGLVKDLEEAVSSGMDLMQRMNRGKKIPVHLAERARSRLRRLGNGINGVAK